MDWGTLFADSLVRPRAAARSVIGRRLARDHLVMAAGAVVALGVVLGYAAVLVSGEQVDAVSAALLTSPLIGAAIQFFVLLFVAVLTWRIGRAFGGKGDLDGSLAVVVWLNAMVLLVQVLQVAVLAVLPPIAGLLAVATVVWVFWAFANFVTELHGFENPLFVLGGVILSMIVVFFALAMVLGTLGITPQEAVQ
jgi:hypothetical protein